MGLTFYLALFFVYVGTNVVNSQSINGTDDQTSIVDILLGTPQTFLSSSGIGQTCPYSPSIDCTNKKTFRTIDGSCNNPNSAYAGKSDTPYIRVFPPIYADNLKEPFTKGFFGLPLPLARNVSNVYFTPNDLTSTNLTYMGAIFARFVEQDLYDTKLLDASGCCQSSSTSSACDNIKIESSDPYFGIYKVTCLPKAKAVASTPLDCKAGIIQQVNKNTHFLDLSNLYGSTAAISDSLRTKIDGLLKESTTSNFLSNATIPECQLPSTNPNNAHCFLAGDKRINNSPLLMTLYTLWFREHNHVAKHVKANNPTYDDEKIFQTARKIVIAEYQHIIYKELIPSLTGKPDLNPLPTGHTTFSATPKPNIANIFSIGFTALIDTLIRKDFEIDGTNKNLEDNWFKPELLFETDGIKKIVTGLFKVPAGKFDRNVVAALTNKYLEITPGQGTDKVALNIKQSYENGIPNYYIVNSIISKAFDIIKYNQLTNLEASAATELKKLYPFVFNAGFVPGILGENPETDAEMGKSLLHIVEDQFKRSKEGDAFYYENTGIFTTERLTEIRKVSFSNILCRHAGLTHVLENVFLLIGIRNPEYACQGPPIPDLCKWATADWSDWSVSPCIGGYTISTRTCQFTTPSTCKCEGSPLKFEPCPSNLVLGESRVDIRPQIEKEYYKTHNSSGHELPGGDAQFKSFLNTFKTG